MLKGTRELMAKVDAGDRGSIFSYLLILQLTKFGGICTSWPRAWLFMQWLQCNTNMGAGSQEASAGGD